MPGNREFRQERKWCSFARPHQIQIGRSRMFQKTKEEWLDAGDAFYGSERYEEVLAAYEQALRFDPNNASFHHSRGSALYALDRYQEALAAFEQAVRLDPTKALYHSARGDALYELERYEEALASYEQTIRLDPAFVHAYN